METLERVRATLAARINDPKAKMLGLSDDLRVMVAGFDELERRCGVLAAALLHKHYWPDEPMHAAVFEALAEMSANARSIRNAAEHGAMCTCHDCTLRTLNQGHAHGG